MSETIVYYEVWGIDPREWGMLEPELMFKFPLANFENEEEALNYARDAAGNLCDSEVRRVEERQPA